MIRLVLYLLAVAVAAIVAVWFANHPGRFAVEWLGYSIDMPVALGLLALLVLMALAGLGYGGWRWLRRAPGAVRQRLRARGAGRALRALDAAALANAAGDTTGAVAALARAGRRLAADDPRLLLLRAASARRLGDAAAEEAAWERLAATAEGAAAGSLQQALLHYRAGEGDAARAIVGAARRTHPHGAALDGLAIELALAAGDTEAAEKALSGLRRQKGPAKPLLDDIEALIDGAAARRAWLAGDTAAADRAARQALRKDTAEIVALGLRLEVLAGNDGNTARRARKLLENAWEKRPHPAIAGLAAGVAGGGSEIERMRRIEALAAKAPENIESHLMLAAEAQAAGLWGLARDHLGRALAATADRRAYDLAARFETAAGKPEKAGPWRHLAATAPGAVWRCGHCQTGLDYNTMLCPDCLAIGSRRWVAPGPLAAAALPALSTLSPAAPGERHPDKALPDLYRGMALAEALDAPDEGWEATDGGPAPDDGPAA